MKKLFILTCAHVIKEYGDCARLIIAALMVILLAAGIYLIYAFALMKLYNIVAWRCNWPLSGVWFWYALVWLIALIHPIKKG